MAAIIRILYASSIFSWTVAGLDGALQSSVPRNFFSYTAWLGALLLAVAIFIQTSIWLKPKRKRFEAVRVRRGEIADAREISSAFLPDVPSIEQLTSIFEASRNCVWFVRKTSKLSGFSSSKTIGFFSLIKLTHAAEDLFNRNNLDGFRMDRTHIAGPNSVSEALYVGGLGARGFYAKGWLIEHVRTRIDSFFEEGGRVVFTRPVTVDGLRVAEKMGFRPVQPDRSGLNCIYKLDSHCE